MPGEAQEKPRRGQEAEAQEGPTDRPTWSGNVLKPFVFLVKNVPRGSFYAHETSWGWVVRLRGGPLCFQGVFPPT